MVGGWRGGREELIQGERKRGKGEQETEREYRLLDRKGKVSKEGVIHQHFKEEISLQAVQRGASETCLTGPLNLS
jgi:hypothetical protein